jgi:hypothetical protein
MQPVALKRKPAEAPCGGKRPKISAAIDSAVWTRTADNRHFQGIVTSVGPAGCRVEYGGKNGVQIWLSEQQFQRAESAKTAALQRELDLHRVPYVVSEYDDAGNVEFLFPIGKFQNVHCVTKYRAWIIEFRPEKDRPRPFVIRTRQVTVSDRPMPDTRDFVKRFGGAESEMFQNALGQYVTVEKGETYLNGSVPGQLRKTVVEESKFCFTSDPMYAVDGELLFAPGAAEVPAWTGPPAVELCAQELVDMSAPFLSGARLWSPELRAEVDRQMLAQRGPPSFKPDLQKVARALGLPAKEVVAHYWDSAAAIADEAEEAPLAKSPPAKKAATPKKAAPEVAPKKAALAWADTKLGASWPEGVADMGLTPQDLAALRGREGFANAALNYALVRTPREIFNALRENTLDLPTFFAACKKLRPVYSGAAYLKLLLKCTGTRMAHPAEVARFFALCAHHGAYALDEMFAAFFDAAAAKCTAREFLAVYKPYRASAPGRAAPVLAALRGRLREKAQLLELRELYADELIARGEYTAALNAVLSEFTGRPMLL